MREKGLDISFFAMLKKREWPLGRLKMGIIALVILLSLAIISGGIWWSWASKAYSKQDVTEMIAITPGMTANQVGMELERRHIIRSARVFGILAAQLHADSKLYAGEYFLSTQMTPREILNELLEGPEVAAIRITIPEGYTTDQIVNLLVQKGIGTKDEYAKVIASDVFSYDFLQGIPQDKHRLDGFLFPDTYFLDKKATPHTAIDLLLQRFQKEVTPDAESQLKAMKLSIRNWVNLASLVEKEALKQTDRPIIAGVFMNRLESNMPLQSCASIQYLLGTPRAKLYDKDLQIQSPYNTYLHTGLPPGPIASPGHASLEAVLHPTKTDYFYFVAKPDGYHAFAKTFIEHLENQRKYQ